MSADRPAETFQVRDERKPGHHWADNEVLDVHGKFIGAYGYAIYMAMSRFSSNRTGECSKSQGELAELLGLSKDTVQRYEVKLQERMLIHKRQVKGKSCVYILLEVAKAGSSPRAGETGAKELPLTAAREENSIPLTAATLPQRAVGGKSDIPLTALTLPPEAVTMPLSAAANKEVILSSKLNKTRPSASSDAADPRHAPIRDFIESQILKAHPEMQGSAWDASAASQLGQLLKKKPAASAELIISWAENYFASEGVSTAGPARSIVMALEHFASGPRDRYDCVMAAPVARGECTLHPGSGLTGWGGCGGCYFAGAQA